MSDRKRSLPSARCACGTHSAEACALAGVCGRGATGMHSVNWAALELSDRPIMKWEQLRAKALELGGAPAGTGFTFPSTDAENQFLEWYARNSPPGLSVRTKVVQPVTVVTAPAAPGFRTLKELRMWHWREFKGCIEQARKLDPSTHSLRLRTVAHLHLSAVQVLDYSRDWATTAEQDCAEADRVQS